MAKLIRSLTIFTVLVIILASCLPGQPEAGNSADSGSLVGNIPAEQNVSTPLVLTTAANPTIYNQVGQQITFTYVIQNTGAVNLGPDQFKISDNLISSTPFNCGPADATLAPNATVTCTAPYYVTEADMTAVSITNIATASGGGAVPSLAASTTVNKGTSTLALSTTANPLTYSAAGQQITFTYVIQNTGTVNLGPAQFTISDNLISATPFNCGPADTTLAPNTTVTCTAPYNVTQADMTAVSITNIATASGGGAAPSPAASTTVNKTGNTTDMQHTVETGEWIWQIARCYGVDPKKLIADNSGKLPNPSLIQKDTILTIKNPGSYSKYYGRPCIEYYQVQSGDTWNSIALKFNADPTVMQLANKNTLTVGSSIKVPLNSAGGAVIPPTQNKVLALTTSADPSTYDQAGQNIIFTYTIKNNGNVNLGPDQFTISDQLISTTPFPCGSANTTIVPNATITCSATYTITQADMTAVSITNIATASGGGAPVSPSASTTVNKGTKALTLTTWASPLTYNAAGQQILFLYEIKNSGNITLGPAQFTISDNLIGATPFNCGSVNTTIAPGATITCSATYVITQTDMTAVSVTNIATASGGGAGPSPTASATVIKQ